MVQSRTKRAPHQARQIIRQYRSLESNLRPLAIGIVALEPIDAAQGQHLLSWDVICPLTSFSFPRFLDESPKNPQAHCLASAHHLRGFPVPSIALTCCVFHRRSPQYIQDTAPWRQIPRVLLVSYLSIPTPLPTHPGRTTCFQAE